MVAQLVPLEVFLCPAVARIGSQLIGGPTGRCRGRKAGGKCTDILILIVCVGAAASTWARTPIVRVSRSGLHRYQAIHRARASNRRCGPLVSHWLRINGSKKGKALKQFGGNIAGFEREGWRSKRNVEIKMSDRGQSLTKEANTSTYHGPAEDSLLCLDHLTLHMPEAAVPPVCRRGDICHRFMLHTVIIHGSSTERR